MEDIVSKFRALANRVNEQKEKERHNAFNIAIKFGGVKQQFIDEIVNSPDYSSLSTEEIIDKARAAQKKEERIND
jgi:hypothetical protein